MNKLKKFLPFIIIFILSLIFFKDLILFQKIPIPADTIVGLYYPFRDIYSDTNPNGIAFKNFAITDPVRQQYPWKELSVDVIKKGEMPYWNPYNFSGYPSLANFQTAAFYPLNLFFFIFSFNLAWSILIFIQPVLAGIFMFLYLRNLKLSSEAALFGSISFSFSGFFISWLEWGNVINTALWLPLILLSVDKITYIRKNYLWMIILILSLASSFLAGHLQIFFYIFILSFLYALVKIFIQKNEKKIIDFIFVITGFLILSAFQIFNTFQFISQSARSIDQDWHKEGWFIPWQNLAQFIAPDFFGNPATLNYWGTWNYGEFIGYIGILPLFFAIYALLKRRDKKTYFFSLLLLFTLIFALPNLIAKIPYKFSFPFVSTSQPTRLLLIIDFSLSVLAALGLDSFLKRKSKIIVFPAAIVSFILLSLWAFVYFNIGSYITNENSIVTINNLKLPSLIILISLILITLIYFSKRKLRILFITILFLVVIFDLFRFGWKYTPFSDEKYLFPDTKVTNFLKSNVGTHRIMSTDSRIFPPNFSTVYRIQTIDGYDPLYLLRTGELTAANERGKPDIGQPFGFNRILTPQNFRTQLINFLGVKYILSLDEVSDYRINVKKVFEYRETKIYENLNVFPRSFFVKKTRVSSNKQEQINFLFDEKVDLRQEAIIETDEKLNKEWSVGDSKIVYYSENKVVIQTDNTNVGFLILSDTYYPNWKVKIDGKLEKIYQTNFNFRGIIVPSGKHTIEFFYSLI